MSARRHVVTGFLLVTVGISAAGGAALARAVAPRPAVLAQARERPARPAPATGGRSAAEAGGSAPAGSPQQEDPHLRPLPATSPVPPTLTTAGSRPEPAAAGAPSPGVEPRRRGTGLPAAGGDLAGRLAGAIRAGGTSMSPDQVAAVAATIVREAGRYGLDPWLVYAVIRRESNFNPGERGAAGEIGLMQILPSTAWWINGHLIGRAGLQLSSLLDPSLNVDFGTAYLAELLRENGGDLARALTAYNSGSSWAAPNRYALEVLAILAAARRQFEPAEPLAGPGGAPASPPPRPAPAGS